MNFCSNCGSAEIKYGVPAGDNRPRWMCQSCTTIHYSNPNIVAGCLPIWKDQVLLCRRAIEPRKGYWNVPGGYLENGERVEDGAMREVWEEALAKVINISIHTIYSLPHINQVYMHFLGDLASLEYGVGEESEEVALFTQAEIPWKEIAFTSSVFTLKSYYEDLAAGEKKVHIGHFDHEKFT